MVHGLGSGVAGVAGTSIIENPRIQRICIIWGYSIPKVNHREASEAHEDHRITKDR
jgi:hypothetical protein